MPFRTSLAAILLLSWTQLSATTVEKLSFTEVVATASAIVHGQVVRSWPSWDPDHTAIWTHYEIRIQDALKGRPASILTISEPGGDLDGKHMQIVGAPRYEVGEEVVVFAAPTAIGYLRTCGWGQGKFAVRQANYSPSGRVVRSGAAGLQLVEAAKPPATPVLAAIALDGSDLDAFLSRVRAEVAAQAARGSR